MYRAAGKLQSQFRLRTGSAATTWNWSPVHQQLAHQSDRKDVQHVDEHHPPDDKVMKWFRKFRLHPDNMVTKNPNLNRYLMVIPPFLNHLCLGSIFAWSILNEPLTRINGVVTPSAADWLLGDITPVFSLVMGGFVWGAVFGKYMDKWGPRVSCLIGGSGLGAGYCLASVASEAGSLPLMYVAGAVWGLANGWAYVPPVTTLLKWFPEKKGFASGACLLGFGGGAVVAAPLFMNLLEKFRKAPEYLGHFREVHDKLHNIDGRFYIESMEGLREVVVASASDLKGWALTEGVYAVGTGSTGISETFLTMGLGYWGILLACALALRSPPPGWAPKGVDLHSHSTPGITRHNVDVSVATWSPQFWIMWTAFGLSITGSYGILSAGKTMLTEAFGKTMPAYVTPAFASAFVSAMSVGNLGGRIVWPALSDWLGRKGDPFHGRKLTYSLMWGLGAPLYGVVVYSIHASQGAESVLPLALFTVSVAGILSSFGGSAANRPALVGDTFGMKNVGVLSARQLAVVMPAAYLGPKLVTVMREKSIHEAIVDLSTKVSDQDFEDAFGLGKDNLETLVQTKTVTMQKLLDICPPGTFDPSPFVYDQTMGLMAVLVGSAFLLNQTLHPLDPKHHMPTPQKKSLTPPPAMVVDSVPLTTATTEKTYTEKN